MNCVESVRVAHPLFQAERDGSTPVSTLQVSDLVFERCDRKYAASLNREWHSRLPKVEWFPMKFAFHARFEDVTYAVAMWSSPVTNMVPTEWLELRRMACSPEFPKNGASAFLSWMVRYLKKNSSHPKLISYQDTAVHRGTIYRAAGWSIGRTSKTGNWNRPNRFRPDSNGPEIGDSIKTRWEKVIR